MYKFLVFIGLGLFVLALTFGVYALLAWIMVEATGILSFWKWFGIIFVVAALLGIAQSN